MTPDSVGAVLIGRNEGLRLIGCLDSLPAGLAGAVYVDSGSSDGSVEAARSRGLEVVELDASVPFTAARARNEGFARLLDRWPQLDAVMFVDGDCALSPGWLGTAREALASHPGWVAVCGWRRERRRDASLYNRLCDLEWNAAPEGDVGDFGFGGDVLIRVPAFQAVGGYDASLIAGEDPEFSARLRWAGGGVHRLDRTMTEHDADMHRFSAWWVRSMRAGHAFAEVGHLHRERRLFARNLRSTWIFGFAVPGGALALAAFAPWLALLVLSIWPLQALRVARGMDGARFHCGDRLLWGASCMLSQVPKLWGTVRFHANRLRGRRETLLEYKGQRADRND